MKKVLLVLLVVVGIIVLIAGAAAAYINFSDLPHYETKKFDYKATATPEKLERGKKLVSMLCASCHTNPETGLLTGQHFIEVPPEFGTIYSQNITQDPTYGIANYTDAELLFLLRTGIKRDGQYAPPYMAKLPHMADEDVESIIAFLRSDDPMVAPQKVADTPCEPSFLVKFLSRVAFKPLPFPEHKIAMPDTNNMVELGRYYIYNLDCFTCHSADFKTMNVLDPPKSPGYLGGGNKPLNQEGQVVLTSNITPDKETGIGSWSEEKFVKALKSGIKDGEPALRYPMVPFHLLTDHEAKAIYAYLMTVPPIKNKVERPAL